MRSRILLVCAGLLTVVLAFMSASGADISHDPAAPVAIPYDGSVDFSLIGSHGGSFAYYSIVYPGDGRVITIDLDLAPGDPVAMRAAGFNVYGPNGYFIGAGSKTKTTADRKQLLWSDFNPATWLIQVYNYLDGVPVAFHLEVSGLPAPQPTRAPVMLASEAKEFSMASDNLLGDHGGNYHYYKIASTGDGSDVILHLYHAPDDRFVSQGFGINVYAPRDGMLAASGSHEAQFKLEVPGTYLVQVYNYVHGINVSYVLTHD